MSAKLPSSIPPRTNRQAVAETRAEAGDERDRQRMQRRPGQVHQRLARREEVRWFSTTSVLENLTPRLFPCAAARVRGARSFRRPPPISRPRRTRGRGPRCRDSRGGRAGSRRAPRRPSRVGLSLTTTSRPTSPIRCRTIASISPGGQPWKVDSVSVSEMRVGNGRSRNASHGAGICALSRSTTAVASSMPSRKPRTLADRIPARS